MQLTSVYVATWWCRCVLLVGWGQSQLYIIQGVTRPMFISAAVGTTLMPFYLWLFVLRLGWGLVGGAASYTAAVISIAAVNIAVVVVRERRLRQSAAPHRCFTGWYV